MDYSIYKFLEKNNFVRYYTLDNDALCPMVCAYEYSEPTKRTVGPWKLQHYVVHFIISGEGFVYYDNKKTVAKKGDIFAIMPNRTLSYMQNPENPWKSIWVEFTGSECHHLFESVGIDENNLILPVRDFEKFERLFLDLLQSASDNDDPEGYLTIGKIYSIFGMLKEELPQKIDLPYNDDIIRSAIDYINTNYCYKISPGEIAKSLFVSPQYLARLFKKNLGVSPSEYITSVRLKHAAQMLTNTNLRINAISEAVGFASPYYFSVTFKKGYMFCPKIYREAHRKNNG